MQFVRLQQHLRIIPTRMGTRDLWQAYRDESQDHPHAYGDKLKSEVFLLKISGSSPRVWGQVVQNKYGAENIRIIPTRMGTRFNEAHLQEAVEDHPHAYGDKWLHHQQDSYHLGSSPRVWGQAWHFGKNRKYRKIIPTRMGTSHNSWYNACIK